MGSDIPPYATVDDHVHCTHWEPLPGGREVCCTCDHVGDVDNPEADVVYEQNERLRAAVDAFLAYADTHVEGPVIDDSYHSGPICADEDCQGYWPCAVEELRRATRR